MTLLTDPSRRRWIGWGLLVAAFFLVSLHRSATAVLSGDLSATFETSALGLGLLHSSFFYLYAAFQVPAGLLTDRFGARAIAATGTTLMSVGAIVFGLAPTFVVAFAGRLLVGLGASVLFVAALRFCANWFRPGEFGTMTGATFSVGILGGLAATTPLALALEAAGWRLTVAGIGVAGVGIALGIVLFSQDSPAAAGLPAIDDVPDQPEVTAADLSRYTRRALGEVETWLLGLMLFFTTGIGITIFGLWGVPYLVHTHGVSVTEASVYLLIGNVGGFVGPTLFGWLSDRLGRRTELIVVSTAVFALTWAVFAVAGTVPLALVAVTFFVSRVLRGGIPLIFTVVKERHPEGASGTVIGIVNTMGWIGAAVFPVLLGAALDAYALDQTVDGQRVYTETGYRIAFAIAVAGGILAAACAIALHRRTGDDGTTETTGVTEQPVDEGL